MPLHGYFKGHGEEVMRAMRKKYGERAKEVFYRTANKKGMTPKGDAVKRRLAKRRKK